MTITSDPKLLTEADYVQSANRLGISTATIKAVAKVEAPRGGFNPEGFPTTLFEGHKFHKFTKGKYDSEYPSISYPEWTRIHYRDWAGERDRLALAISLDRDAALRSASWGKFQIMGFNHEIAGCSEIQEFVNRNCHSEGEQLTLFCNYIENEKLVAFLRLQDWEGFAARYNGSGYKVNKYDTKLRDAYDMFSRSNP